MANRAVDWYHQAERDLEQAVDSQAAGRHEWTCFAAQQAAAKAVRALHRARGQEAWGHVVARLLTELPEAPPAELVERGRVLDNFYTPARYPDSHPEGAPFEHFGPLQSQDALNHARAIVTHVRDAMA
jgi:HEPN domain-containing protein